MKFSGVAVRRAGLAIALLAIALAPARAALVEAVEFYNTGLKHYFVTAYAGEMSGIEAGAAGPGWIRTGGSFRVYTSANDAPGLSAVCRFYGTPGRGPNSHFYTADPGECEAVKRDPGWTFEGIAFYARTPVGGQCAADTLPVYRSYNNGWVRNDSNHRFTIDYAALVGTRREGFDPEAIVLCSPITAEDRRRDAFRLQQQATFGPLSEVTDRIVQIGPAAWIDEQFAMPASRYTQLPFVPFAMAPSCVDGLNKPPPYTAADYCQRWNYSPWLVQNEFFNQAVANADQLRMRVAWAWSQLFVVSANKLGVAYGMADYQQMLRDRALGDFRSLLRAVTVHAAMGWFLDLAGSARAMNGLSPNENYPRELLQLFSVGTVQLDPDGTVKRGADGKPIPTYGQAEVTEFARALTGWSYPPISGQAQFYTEAHVRGDMAAHANFHDSGPKRLLTRTVPAGGTPQSDLDAVLDDLMAHPNTAPFISRYLIQKLVTGDPSAEYVKRVADVFRNNGLGMVGDLRSVVRAILLDPEARGPQKVDTHWGKLIEPVRMITTFARTGRLDLGKVVLQNQVFSLNQLPFFAPSVFNFFPPDYELPGRGVIAPEFGVFNGMSAADRFNSVSGFAGWDGFGNDRTVAGAVGQPLGWTRYAPYAADPPAFVDRLAEDFLGGMLPLSYRRVLVDYAAANARRPGWQAQWTVIDVTQMLLMSPWFQIER